MFIVIHSMEILKSKSYHSSISHPSIALIHFCVVTWRMPSCSYFLTKEIVLSNVYNLLTNSGSFMRLQKSHIPYSSPHLVSFLDCCCNFVELGGAMVFHQQEDDNSHVR